MLQDLILYSTSACHLCEEAESLLKLGNIKWQTIEITDNDVLLERYSFKIPVIYNRITKKELCWPFSLADISIFIS